MGQKKVKPKKYGCAVKRQVLVGVLLDMDMGTLAFSINGAPQGIAFESAALRRGPIWVGLALLNRGGVTLVSGLKKP